jgi:Ribonuclease G/E
MKLLSFFNGGKSNDVEKRHSEAKGDCTSIGNVLLDLGYISLEALEEAVKVQKSQSLLGDILVDMGAVTKEQLEEALLEQKIRRKIAKSKEIIKANSAKHGRLISEVQERFLSLGHKHHAAGKK